MGLGFLWAWIYCLWFSPAVFPTRNGIGVNESPSWLLSCITVMVTMLVVPLTLRRTNRTLESFPAMRIAAPVMMSGGTAVLFLPYPSGNALIDAVFIAGALITGVGAGTLWIQWGELHSRFDAERIEVVVPACAILVVVSLFLVSNMFFPIGGILVCTLPLLSGFLLSQSLEEEQWHQPVAVMPSEKSPIRWSDFMRVGLGSIMIYVVIGYGWSLIDLDTFGQLGQGLEIPYLVGGIFGAAMSLGSIFYARRLNLFLIYRWMLPVMVCALLLSTMQSLFANEIAFILFITAQIGFDIMIWIYFANVSHKGFYSAAVLMGCSRGMAQIGVTSGSVLGLPAVKNMMGGAGGQSTVCLVLVALSVIVIMFVLNQQESFEELIHDDAEGKSESLESAGGFQQCIADLSREYGLSKRESEVFGLLARGRSFPYIREDLFLSKSTVETHAKNLYKKMDVHSKQDLINLVDSRLYR